MSSDVPISSVVEDMASECELATDAARLGRTSQIGYSMSVLPMSLAVIEPSTPELVPTAAYDISVVVAIIIVVVIA